VEATRTVVGVDGTGPTLAHEDGRPRWVAVSDAAMELLEQVQHDFGEGRACWPMPRTGWWPSRTYRASGSGTGSLRWSASCRCGVLSVPVRLDSPPVGTLDVYASQPRAWTPGEVEALGVLAATRGINPDDAFQQLRKRARSSSRKVADLALEVVQAAQRERVAAVAVDDARVRAAEARTRAAEQAVVAAQTGLARRAAALDRVQDDLSARERAADERNHLADQRDRDADERNRLADQRDRDAE
jgi:hypothetical protein